MPKPTGTSNPNLQKLIADLRGRGFREKSNFMLAVADALAKPARKSVKANISKLERACGEKESVIIPGKLLADGTISKPLNIACFSASETARKKIENAGGRLISIEELVEKNPKGAGVRIVC